MPPAANLVLALLAGLPILALLAVALTGSPSGGFGATILPAALRETGSLLLLVGIATSLMGLVAAWLVSNFEFPLRRVFEWAFILPLAIPTYLSAYAWVEFMSFTGPVQEMVRAATGAQTLRDYWFPDIRNVPGAAFVMSLVLYPYVYLSCRAFFLMQSGTVTAASRALGASGSRTFFAVILPLARPAVIVGATLAMMEVVNDLGAVEFFGVKSLTAVIYATWINRADLPGAAQMALTLVLVIGVLIWLEQHARRRRGYLMPRDSRTPPPRTPLSGGRAALAVLFSVLVIGLGFAVPFGELMSTAFGRFVRGSVPEGVWAALIQTVWLALAGALVCVMLGYFTARRARSGGAPLIRLAVLGYAVPGTVLALGLALPLGVMDGWLNDASRALWGGSVGLVLSGSVFALIYAYAVRFLAVSHNGLDSALKKRGDSIIDAGKVLGASRAQIFFRVELPTLRPALAAAGVLVFVECIKELPATLLLRPLGVETLATYVYSQASAELFEAAAVPAVLIVMVGLVPVLLAGRLQASSR
ncbi:ABC transporter permease [Cucumibacter marinus]|uniref:ABC transporter permease n=1 Tax=Cucumibacter marinus TaxID=1121252 RepID=UPI000418CF0F|nr:iron ABC transporter permease [Cucumibacter marinus]